MPLLLPYIKFNVQDWLTSEKVGQMTQAQCGAYIKLLCHCWANANCTLPHDLTKLQSMIHWTDSDGDLSPVLACFHPIKKQPDRCTNARLYDEWKAALHRTTQQQEGGLKGAITRWKKPKPLTPGSSGAAPDWLSVLRAAPLYAHVDWDRELAKIEVWRADPKHKHRKINRQFVVNWVNKIEPPLSNGHAVTLSCPHHPALTFADQAALKRHNFDYHPQFRG